MEECDKYIRQYRTWLSRYGEENYPFWNKSIIQQYRVGHSEPTWKTRLWTKPVFASIWKTDKLLSSMDGIAIGEPPELGRTTFREPGCNWFHIDQGSRREGLHTYQGAVYLEGTTEEDHCFRVIEGTSNNHNEFFSEFSAASKKQGDFIKLDSKHIDWFKEQGGEEKIITVPKGGMVLWDSRNVHDNIAPLKCRTSPDKWRFVVFVSMGPAIWAKDEDINLKQKAYNEMVSTAHWACQGVRLFPNSFEARGCKSRKIIEMINEQPAIAKTKTVKQLAGIEPYDFQDGMPNDPGWEPTWKDVGIVHGASGYSKRKIYNKQNTRSKTREM